MNLLQYFVLSVNCAVLGKINFTSVPFFFTLDLSTLHLLINELVSFLYFIFYYYYYNIILFFVRLL